MIDPTRVAGGLPSRHRGRGVEGQPTIGHQQADHGVEHGLGDGPREQGGVAHHRLPRLPPLGQEPSVPLVHQAAAVDHDHGVGLMQRPLGVEGLVHGGGQVDAVGRRALGPLRPGPRHVGRL